MFTKRPQNSCKDCRYTWYPKGKDLSRFCPRCGGSNIALISTGCGCSGCATFVLAVGGLFFLLALLGASLVKKLPGPSPQSTKKGAAPSATGSSKQAKEQEAAKTAAKAADASKIVVTSTIVKRLDGNFRYFFDIRNWSKTPFTGSVRITLLNKKPGITNGSDTFDTKKAILPELGTFVYMDANTGPESAHANAAVSSFRYEILDGSKVLATNTGIITTKLEILDR